MHGKIKKKKHQLKVGHVHSKE